MLLWYAAPIKTLLQNSTPPTRGNGTSTAVEVPSPGSRSYCQVRALGPWFLSQILVKTPREGFVRMLSLRLHRGASLTSEWSHGSCVHLVYTVYAKEWLEDHRKNPWNWPSLCVVTQSTHKIHQNKPDIPLLNPQDPKDQLPTSWCQHRRMSPKVRYPCPKELDLFF